MSTTSSAPRWILLVAVAVSAGLTAGACGRTAPAGDPAVPPLVPVASGVDSIGTPPPAPTTSAPTKVAASFPDTAKAYATAVVKAWKQGQTSALASLTTPEVYEQIVEIPQPLNDAWMFLRCDGTAGSSYCLFANADGDELTLRISHARLGKAHAAVEVRLDQTEFPIDGVAYVKEFVAAWQKGNNARMLKLSKPDVVDQLKTAPVNPTYPAPVCCGGGLLQVKVKWGTSSARFDVGTTLLGGPHAIVGYAPPLPVIKA